MRGLQNILPAIAKAEGKPAEPVATGIDSMPDPAGKK
jgi:hypothetical protein